MRSLFGEQRLKYRVVSASWRIKLVMFREASMSTVLPSLCATVMKVIVGLTGIPAYGKVKLNCDGAVTQQGAKAMVGVSCETTVASSFSVMLVTRDRTPSQRLS